MQHRWRCFELASTSKFICACSGVRMVCSMDVRFILVRTEGPYIQSSVAHATDTIYKLSLDSRSRGYKRARERGGSQVSYAWSDLRAMNLVLSTELSLGCRSVKLLGFSLSSLPCHLILRSLPCALPCQSTKGRGPVKHGESSKGSQVLISPIGRAIHWVFTFHPVKR
jgi:hypothetical protein